MLCLSHSPTNLPSTVYRKVAIIPRAPGGHTGPRGRALCVQQCPLINIPGLYGLSSVPLRSLSHPSSSHDMYIVHYPYQRPIHLWYQKRSDLLVRTEVHTLTSTTPKLALALSLIRHTTLQFRTTSLSRDEHAPVTERSAVYEPRRSPAPGKRVGTERAHFGADR